VYKLFKNGKRAKAPICVFEYGDPETVNDYFNEEVRENFTKKLRESRVLIVRGDLPQEREEDKDVVFRKNFQKRKNRVFAKYLKLTDQSSFGAAKVVGGLVFCAQSGWKWQWAALESGTSRYLAGLSPTFKGTRAAEEWMSEEMSKL
jgi:hypothetical protein